MIRKFKITVFLSFVRLQMLLLSLSINLMLNKSINFFKEI